MANNSGNNYSGRLRSGGMYQRQLAMVTARTRSPTPPLQLSPPSRSPPRSPLRAPFSSTIASAAAAAAAAAADPYRIAIMAHVGQLRATKSSDSSFVDANVIATLDFDTNHPTFGFSPSVWKCPICIGVPRQPVSISTCGHICCDRCIHQLMTANPSVDFTTHKCPICRTQFKSNDILHYGQWPLLLKQMWALMRVRCENCDYESSPQRMVEHERQQCDKRVVTCPGCWFSASLDAAREHVLQCNHILVNCISCGHPIRYNRRQLHDCEAVLADENHRLSETGPRGAVSHPSAVSVDDMLWAQHVAHTNTAANGVGDDQQQSSGSGNVNHNNRNSSVFSGLVTLADFPATSPSTSSTSAVPPASTEHATTVTAAVTETTTAAAAAAAAAALPLSQTRRYSHRARRRTIFDS